MKQLLFLVCIFLQISIASCNTSKETNSPKPRVIICSDINNVGGDPDDKQSMAHLLMYANDVDIVAIIPDYWNGKGVEATMEIIDAYEMDYNNSNYNFQKLDYPTPEKIRNLVQTEKQAAIKKIISEATINKSPLHILIWGGMTTVRDALNETPDIVGNIRIYTIGTHRMMQNPDAETNSKDTVVFGLRNNWNYWGRNDIYNDERFNDLWWLENDWGYNGMFEGNEPAEFLLEIKEFGALGNKIWELVQKHSWAHYFRAGDTPTLLYLLEPGVDIGNPASSSWAGKFVNPYPETRPNYWIDDAGIDDWDYANPENTWKNAQQVYDFRVKNLVKARGKMYAAYRKKMKELYNQ